MFNTQLLQEKWKSVLDHESLPKIKDPLKRAVVSRVLENQKNAIAEERGNNSVLTEAVGNTTGASIANWDPVLIGLVRRTMANLIAYDIAGVQPMTMPTGLIFAMKAQYTSAAGVRGGEALFDEMDTTHSGTGTHGGDSSSLPGTDANTDGVDDAFSYGVGMSTSAGELLGEDSNPGAKQMAFSIEKTMVEAKTRALRASYTSELAQDLRNVHDIDVESELANILTTEILGEINREMIRTINSKAKLGAQTANTAVKGIFNLSTDADGRWSVEKFKGLMLQIEREANVISKETRRGKGNFIVCSSDIASALASAGILDYSPAIATNITVDDTGNTFAGILNGRTKVFIDPYAVRDYITVGYRGSNPYDAGIFYAPYVPLTMMRATNPESFNPRIGFKTRYGMVANPFAGGAGNGGTGTNRANQYFRIFAVTELLTSADSVMNVNVTP